MSTVTSFSSLSELCLLFHFTKDGDKLAELSLAGDRLFSSLYQALPSVLAAKGASSLVRTGKEAMRRRLETGVKSEGLAFLTSQFRASEDTRQCQNLPPRPR